MSRKRRKSTGSQVHRGPKPAGKSINSVIDSVNRYFQEGRLQEAETACRQVLRKQPKNQNAIDSLAQILCRDGRPGEAIDLLQDALKRRPDAGCYNSLGVALRAQGDNGGAIEAFANAIKIRPMMAEAFANIADAKTYSQRDTDVVAMERLLENKAISPTEKMRLHFALAKIFDDLGEYEMAFSHLSSGNRLKRDSITYDIGHQELLVDRLIAIFTKRFLRSFGASSAGFGSLLGSLVKTRPVQTDSRAARSIFVVGMPRSGTTLVEQIISSHSQVCGAGEHSHFKDLVALPLRKITRCEKGFPDSATDVSQEALDLLGKEYLDAMRRHCPNAERIVDKTPMNFLFIGLIWMLWPTARVINCVRDPVATCYSCYTKHFSGDQPFAYDLTELGRYYRGYERLMRHWHSVLPGFVLDVRYETLVSELEPEVARILEFCGLPWEQECLQFHQNKRPVLTASAAQVRRPVYGTAVAHWRHYEPYLGELRDALGQR